MPGGSRSLGCCHGIAGHPIGNVHARRGSARAPSWRMCATARWRRCPRRWGRRTAAWCSRRCSCTSATRACTTKSGRCARRAGSSWGCTWRGRRSGAGLSRCGWPPHADELRAALGPAYELEDWTASWCRLHRTLPLRRLDAALAAEVGESLAALIIAAEPAHPAAGPRSRVGTGAVRSWARPGAPPTVARLRPRPAAGNAKRASGRRPVSLRS